jgi:hypothetical protein
MEEERKVYKVLVGKPGGKRPLERPRRRWEDGIRMDLREIGLGGNLHSHCRENLKSFIQVWCENWLQFDRLDQCPLHEPVSEMESTLLVLAAVLLRTAKRKTRKTTVTDCC